MGLEIEAKMRLDDPPAIEQLLSELGARWVGELLECNTYFDTADGSLKSSDQGLRVRVEQMCSQPPVAIITHKGPRAQGQIKNRSETELRVEDARCAGDLLAALGFEAKMSFPKRRRRWEMDHCLIELDTLPYLGNFIEIEGPGENAIMAVRTKLGLANAPLITASYIALLCDYAREHQLKTTNIKFPVD